MGSTHSRSWIGSALVPYGTMLPCLALVLVPLLCAGCDQAEIAGSKCSDDHPCPTRYACVEGICYPKGPFEGLACSQTEDCPAGVCLVQSHVCVACIHHEDCVSRLCEPQTHICLGCKADYQCPEGSCDRATGICAESPTEGERRSN